MFVLSEQVEDQVQEGLYEGCFSWVMTVIQELFLRLELSYFGF